MLCAAADFLGGESFREPGDGSKNRESPREDRLAGSPEYM